MLDSLLEGLGELIGAGGGLGAAFYSLKAGDGVGGAHAFNEAGDALEVAVAATEELDVGDDVAFVEVDDDDGGTGATGVICELTRHFYQC